MRERRSSEDQDRSRQGEEELASLLERVRRSFGADHEGYRAWVEAYRASGWRRPPVRRLRLTDDG